MMKEENKALLDWAVDNITEWDENYTHLRSDWEGCYYTRGEWKAEADNSWGRMGGSLVSCEPLSPRCTSLPEVISKQQWLDAQKTEGPNDNNFTKSMLVAGKHVVKTREGGLYTPIGGFFKGIEGGGYLLPYNYSEELLELEREYECFDIVAVYEVGQKEDHLGFNESFYLVWYWDEKNNVLCKEKEELEKRLTEIEKELEGL